MSAAKLSESDKAWLLDTLPPAMSRRVVKVIEATSEDAERYRFLRDHAHWEDERDCGPGGRWWVSVNVKKGRPNMEKAVDAARKDKQS
ncbi:hypothetical protein AB6809_29605 [Paraburkholderia sp. RCC_158]|uniref:hypothetical protein n=1 Tax=Paraburkholderia sp. RCC_158 TaxID=3239220 RepID=UPI003524BAF7